MKKKLQIKIIFYKNFFEKNLFDKVFFTKTLLTTNFLESIILMNFLTTIFQMKTFLTRTSITAQKLIKSWKAIHRVIALHYLFMLAKSLIDVWIALIHLMNGLFWNLVLVKCCMCNCSLGRLVLKGWWSMFT